MEEESPLIADVREWLEKGGFVLEMQVARALGGWGAVVDQGFRYSDPVTGKEREGDLRAWVTLSRGEPLHRLHVFAECKATAAPWVFFVGERSDTVGPWQPGQHTDPHCEICSATLSAARSMGRPLHAAYAVSEKRNANAPDHAYQAVQQVASAVIAEYGDEIHWGGHDMLLMDATEVAVPIVVTTSPLVACALDHGGDVVMEEVDRIIVKLPRAEVPPEIGSGLHVTVVRFSALGSFLAELNDAVVSPAATLGEADGVEETGEGALSPQPRAGSTVPTTSPSASRPPETDGAV